MRHHPKSPVRFRRRRRQLPVAKFRRCNDDRLSLAVMRHDAGVVLILSKNPKSVLTIGFRAIHRFTTTFNRSAGRRVVGIRHQQCVPVGIKNHGRALVGHIQESAVGQGAKLAAIQHDDVGFTGKPNPSAFVGRNRRRQLRIKRPFPRPIRPAHHRAKANAPKRTIRGLAQMIKTRIGRTGHRG